MQPTRDYRTKSDRSNLLLRAGLQSVPPRQTGPRLGRWATGLSAGMLSTLLFSPVLAAASTARRSALTAPNAQRQTSNTQLQNPVVQNALTELVLDSRSAAAALGGEFQVNTYTTSQQSNPAVARDADGDFVVVWGSMGSSGTDTDYGSIHSQRYNSAGAAQGGEFQVNTYTTSVKSGMKSPLFRGLKRPLISGKNVRWTGGGGCFRIR